MSNLIGKKLLVFGGFPMMLEAVVWAKQMGVYTIVTDYYPDSPAKRVADEAWDISTADIDVLAERCRKIGVDGCFASFDDFNIARAAELSEMLGLTFYTSSHLTTETMDKAHFKRNLMRFGVSSTPEYTVEECASKNNFPVIVKPVDGSGSRGISVCRTAEELDSAIQHARDVSRSGRLLIERYIESDEVGINYILQEGRSALTAMHDRYLQADSTYGPVRLPLAYTYPSKHLDEYLMNGDASVREMLKSLGMKNGSMFLQGCFLQGETLFYEMGYRLNGAKQYQIIERECGFNPMHALIEYSLLGRMSDDDLIAKANPRFSRHYCTLSLLANPGTIARVVGLERIAEELPDAEITQWSSEGDTIPESARGTQKQIATRITVSAKSLDELAAAIRFVNESYDVLDADGCSMVVEKFDTNRLYA